MRIIEQGVLPEDRVHIVRCGQCLSKIEFFRKEAQISNAGDDFSLAIVGCPVCGNELRSTFETPRQFGSAIPVGRK